MKCLRKNLNKNIMLKNKGEWVEHYSQLSRLNEFNAKEVMEVMEFIDFKISLPFVLRNINTKVYILIEQN